MIGPTLLDLKIALSASNVTIQQISYVLPGRAAGYALGSLITGLCYKYFNPMLALGVCIAFKTIVLVIAPYNRTLWGMVLTFFTNGLAGGCLDSVGNVWILDIWGKEASPFMQR